MWLIRITGKYTCETMYPHHFLHQSGYILGTHDFGFYYYFTNIGGVFLIYLHWKHGLSYTFEIQWMLDNLTGGIFRGLICAHLRSKYRVWERNWALRVRSNCGGSNFATFWVQLSANEHKWVQSWTLFERYLNANELDSYVQHLPVEKLRWKVFSR